MPRRSIEITTFAHVNPIPAASRIGPLVVSSIIPAFEPGSRTLPDAFDDQLANVFTHAGEILKEAGASWGDVIRMTFYVSDIANREGINDRWAALFPVADSRPARYTQLVPPSGKMLVSADLMAYVEG